MPVRQEAIDHSLSVLRNNKSRVSEARAAYQTSCHFGTQIIRSLGHPILHPIVV